MPIPVSLRAFVNEMEVFSETCHVFLNRATGEFVGLTDEYLSAAEEGDEEDEEDEDPPNWEDKLKLKAKEVMSSDDWLELPDKNEIDEYRIMRDFCGNIEDTTLAQDLYDTIGGRGTFGRWKGMLARHGLLDGWYRFRTEALTVIAKGWLEAHKVPFTA